MLENLNFFKNININFSTVRKITGLVLCILISTFIISYDFLHLGDVKEGDISPINIKADRNFKFTHGFVNQKILDETVSQKIEKVYTKDNEILPNILNKLNDFFIPLEESKRKNYEDDFLREVQEKYFTISPLRISALKVVIQDIIKNILEPGFKEEERKNVFSDFSNKIRNMKRLTETEKVLIIRTVNHFIEPNMFYDEQETTELREKARKRLRPVERYIGKGEIIVREGDKFDRESLEILNKIGYFDEKISFIQKIIGYFLLFVFFSMILILYLKIFNSDILAEEPLVFFIQIIALMTIAGFKFYDVLLSSKVHIFIEANSISVFSVYLFPVAAVAMLVSLVVDNKFSILLSSMLSVIGGLVFTDINFVVVAIIGSIVSVYSIMSAKTRAEQLLSGLYLIITNISLIIALHFINLKFLTFSQNIKFMLRDVMLGFFNGSFSIIFALGTMPVFEKLFKVTSALRLLELTDLNNKLLKTLLEQAPGTYHHSIMVANLAEAAAIEIGADSLLARIGGYYHDIGKIKRPFFFVENLMGKDNQHDNLSANLSAIIIISHAKDGVEIAKSHNLPEEVIDIIKEHHGTTLVKYFFEKAKKEMGDSIKEGQFRYPGPKPQSKEAALVMLADSIESATRSLSTATPSSIDNLIKKITNDKFIDEQFDECNLTLKEIEKIRNVFSKVLLQMFHKRIEYPDSDIRGQGILK